MGENSITLIPQINLDKGVGEAGEERKITSYILYLFIYAHKVNSNSEKN